MGIWNSGDLGKWKSGIWGYTNMELVCGYFEMLFVRNRDSGILSTKVVSTKMAVAKAHAFATRCHILQYIATICSTLSLESYENRL